MSNDIVNREQTGEFSDVWDGSSQILTVWMGAEQDLLSGPVKALLEARLGMSWDNVAVISFCLFFFFFLFFY